MEQYYLWDSDRQNIAEMALYAINNSGWFPQPSFSESVPSGEDTVKWAEGLVTTADGRVGFPKIPNEIMDKMGVAMAEREAWLDAFTPDFILDSEDIEWPVGNGGMYQ
jgi:hypothetical protein